MAQDRGQRRLAAILSATVFVYSWLIEVIREHAGAPQARLDLVARPL
jgi:hypothetical protein